MDINLSTDRQTYTYRAVVFNECEEVITQSQEATTMLLQGFSNPEESVFENNLVWTAYEGFAGGIDRYEVIRKTTLNPEELGSPLTSTNVVQKNHTDDVSDLLDTPGLFCYRILAIENNTGPGLEGAASNWVCLTEEPLVWIPTAFSPNGDELNDWFPWPSGDAQVGFLGAPQGDNSNFELNVYSRWGENIFSSTSVDETWDGRINGKLVPAGVYAVHVRYLDGAGGWHQQRVALTVLPGE